MRHCSECEKTIMPFEKIYTINLIAIKPELQRTAVSLNEIILCNTHLPTISNNFYFSANDLETALGFAITGPFQQSYDDFGRLEKEGCKSNFIDYATGLALLPNATKAIIPARKFKEYVQRKWDSADWANRIAAALISDVNLKSPYHPKNERIAAEMKKLGKLEIDAGGRRYEGK